MLPQQGRFLLCKKVRHPTERLLFPNLYMKALSSPKQMFYLGSKRAGSGRSKMKSFLFLLPPARPENVPLGMAPCPPALIFCTSPKSLLGTAREGLSPAPYSCGGTSGLGLGAAAQGGLAFWGPHLRSSMGPTGKPWGAAAVAVLQPLGQLHRGEHHQSAEPQSHGHRGHIR